MAIKEKRTISAADKVFKEADLLALAKIVSDASASLSQQGRSIHKQFDIVVDEGLSYSTSAYNDLVSDDRLNSTPVSRVEFSSRTYEPFSRIDVSIRHTERSWINYPSSYVTLESESREWVAVTAERVQRVLAAVEPQESTMKWLRSIFRPVIATLLGGAFVFIMLAALWVYHYTFSLSSISSPAGNSPSQERLLGIAFVYIVLGMFAGYAFSLPLFASLDKLWPVVEIRVGPKHFSEVERKRRTLILICSWVIVPLIVNLISAVIIT